jgi:hypothetical protein
VNSQLTSKETLVEVIPRLVLLKRLWAHRSRQNSDLRVFPDSIANAR